MWSSRIIQQRKWSSLSLCQCRWREMIVVIKWFVMNRLVRVGENITPCKRKFCSRGILIRDLVLFSSGFTNSTVIYMNYIYRKIRKRKRKMLLFWPCVFSLSRIVGVEIQYANFVIITTAKPIKYNKFGVSMYLVLLDFIAKQNISYFIIKTS